MGSRLCAPSLLGLGDLASLHSPQGNIPLPLPGAGAQGASTAVTDTALAWENLGLCPGCSTP